MQYGGKNIRNYIQYFLHLVSFPYVHFCELHLSCVYCCILYVFDVSYVYLLYLMCIVPYVYLLCLICICCTLCVFVVLCVYCCFTVDDGLLARSQYLEGPVTGHLDTGFSWFVDTGNCVYKRMLRWFPSFQVATTCFSYSPPDLNFPVTFFIFVYM